VVPSKQNEQDENYETTKMKENTKVKKALVKNGIGKEPLIPNKWKRKVIGASSVMERMKVQWDYLGRMPDVDDWKGFSTAAACCRTGIPRMNKVEWKGGKPNLYQTADDYVPVDFYASGKIVPRGTVKCRGYECSWCGRSKRKEMSDYLEMALSWNTREGGENVFGTLTQQAQTTTECLVALSKAMGELLNQLLKWNKKNKCSVGMFTTQETVFGKEPKFHRYRDTTAGTFGHSYHSHGHFILIVPPGDLHKKNRIIELLRTWWTKAIEKHGGYVYRLGKKSLIKKDRAFRVEASVNPDVATSKYITKHLKSMELVYAETKIGTGLSLEALKTKIHLGSEHQVSYIKMMRNYYKALKGCSRFKSTKEIIGNLVLNHKRHRDWLRTQAAYDFVVRNKYQSLRGLKQREEIIIISQIQQYPSLTGDKPGEDGETMGSIWNIEDWNTYPKMRAYRQDIIKSALADGNVLWNGKKLFCLETLDDFIHDVREREKHLWKFGDYSYLEKTEEYKDDVLVATFDFAKKLYNLLGHTKLLATVLFRMRNWLLHQEGEWFYHFISHLNLLFCKADYEIEKTLPTLDKPNFYMEDPYTNEQEFDDAVKNRPSYLPRESKEKTLRIEKKNYERIVKERAAYQLRKQVRQSTIYQRNEFFTEYLKKALREDNTWLQQEVLEMDKHLAQSRKPRKA
jgi:hypothetical protein